MTIKKFFAVMFIMGMFCIGANANETSGISADEALQKLKDGNTHFSKMHLKHPDLSFARLHELEQGQHPIAAILSCSDSRVPPEIIFDQGLGDLFVVRNAGNVLDDQVIGSMEYAIVHAGVKLVVVLGHEKCGAVKAACSLEHEDKYIESLTSFIKPSVEKAKKQPGDLYNNAAIENAKTAANNLAISNPIIAYYVKNHGVKIVPAFYNLHTGTVEFLNNN